MANNNAVSLSTIRPDFDLILAQLRSAARNKNTWKSFLDTDVGETLLQFISAIGELDQYAISRTFEEMYSESADLDSTLYGITKMLGVRLLRKSPSSTYFRLPDGSNSGSPNSGNTANDYIIKQAYQNPYYDVSLPLGGGATPDAARITNPIMFYSYGKLKRIVSEEFPANLQMSIQPYSKFSSSDGMLFNRVTIKFDAITDISNPNDPGWFGYIEDTNNPGVETAAVLYRGIVTDKFFTPTGRDFFSIVSSEKDFIVSDRDVQVFINNLQLDVVYNGLWNYRLEDLNNSVVQDITTSKGKLHLLFGSDLYGYKPTINDTVQLRYVTTNGLADNALKLKSTKLSNLSYPLDNTTDSCIYPLSGGEDQTPAKDYAFLGPYIYSSGYAERAVTPQDYKTVFDTYPGILDSRVDGQRHLNSSSPAFMNLIRVTTYPKQNETFFNIMTADVKKRSMFSPEFYTTWASQDVPLYPIHRIFNIRANVYCFNLVDLVSARDKISTAILSLVDKLNSPLVGKIGINLTRDLILKTIREAVDGIDYIELLEPSTDVISDMISPMPEDFTIGVSSVPSLTGPIDYAVETFCEDDNTTSSTQRSWNLSDVKTVVGTGKDITVFFTKAPNFFYTVPQLISQNITNYPYLRNVYYRLWRKIKGVPNPEWEAVTTLLAESSLSVSPGTKYSSIVDNGTTVGSPTPAFPLYNAAQPSISLLANNWNVNNTINIYYTSRNR